LTVYGQLLALGVSGVKNVILQRVNELRVITLGSEYADDNVKSNVDLKERFKKYMETRDEDKMYDELKQISKNLKKLNKGKGHGRRRN
jgi:hypothetical protein